MTKTKRTTTGQRNKTVSRPLTLTQLGTLWWALSYPLPSVPAGSDDHLLYYLPGSQRFVESESPLPLEEVLVRGLVPVTLSARVKTALAAFPSQEAEKPSPLVWGIRGGEHGQIITWYPSARLWGRTAYTLRGGKEGTIFARALEPLVADALAHQLLPYPDLATLPLLSRLGMQDIVPVSLDRSSTPLADCVRRCEIEAVSASEPFWRPPISELLGHEWLVSLLYQDRYLVVYHQSRNFPLADAVIWRLLVLRRQLSSCPGKAEWDRLYEETRDPFDFCQQRIGEFEAFCGSQVLAALEEAFIAALSLLERVAQRAAAHPSFVAYVLARYQERHQLTDLHLAQSLGGAVEDLCRLRLCRMPKSDRFEANVRTIAAHAQMHGERLALLLREMSNQ